MTRRTSGLQLRSSGRVTAVVMRQCCGDAAARHCYLRGGSGARRESGGQKIAHTSGPSQPAHAEVCADVPQLILACCGGASFMR